MKTQQPGRLRLTMHSRLPDGSAMVRHIETGKPERREHFPAGSAQSRYGVLRQRESDRGR